MPTEVVRQNYHKGARRYGDTIDWSSKTSIISLAVILSSVLIVMATISLVFVGHFAAREANHQAAINQHARFKTLLDTRFLLLAKYQLSVARWDESVKNVSLDFDKDFVKDDFVDSLWYDFGINRNILIGPDNHILADAWEEEVSYPNKLLDADSPLFSLISHTRKQYFENRISLGSGYGQRNIPLLEELQQPAHGFIKAGSKIGFIHGTPIVPDDGEIVLPDGNPVVLLSIRLIDSSLMNELSDQLNVSQLHFSEKSIHDTAANLFPVSDINRNNIGSFSWLSELPAPHIWQTVIPVIIVLGTSLAIVAFLIAWKIGKLTVSLGRSEKQNWYLAMHDNLTGIANRLQFNRAMDKYIANLPQPFTIIQCDLDRFKQVNDTFGHEAGDIVIKTVAGRLSAAVGENGLVCRIGGDEFVIICNQVEQSVLEVLSATIITEIKKPIEIDLETFATVGISLGIATAPMNGRSARSLISLADQALYKAKADGRNRAVFAGN